MELTNQQEDAFQMVLNNKISIMSGGPGTGKTTTLLEVVGHFKSENAIIKQAAPTGKAARQMSRATGHYASTIHAMLVCNFEGGKFTFGHNKENPLDADLIILDELSMITTNLMASVFDAINIKRTKLLMVGDPYQLPSVGPGAVLRDLLDSGLFPHTELTDIHRSSGEIVKVCHEIKAGRTYTPASKLDLDAETPVNLIHIECSTPEKTMVAVKKIMCERMPLRILNGKHVNPIEDVMVISPVNSKGKLSCLSLNRMLRQEFNPDKNRNQLEALSELKQDAENGAYMKFRTGDKVIQTKNTKASGVEFALSKNLDLGVFTNTEERDLKRQHIALPSYIVNGDMGYIVDVVDQEMVVKFSEPDRYTTIPLVNNELLHAYCITCHRAQGSESPVVIIPVHRQFNMFISNSWIYTALSRGKQIVITCGAFDTVERAIRNRSPNNRKTRLKLRLIQESRRTMEVEFGDI